MKRCRHIIASSRLALWAMMLVFAVAPAFSFASGTATGAFSTALVHSHADGDQHHSNHGHHHHDDAGHHDSDELADNADGKNVAHVHYDACCPSILTSTVVQAGVTERFKEVLQPLANRPTLGAPPGNLLRPPILL